MQSGANISGDASNSLTGDASETSGPPLIADCPKCGTRITCFGNRTAQIDSCGFETYNFQCEKCGARLDGIIDPFDEKLLVTLSEP